MKRKLLAFLLAPICLFSLSACNVSIDSWGVYLNYGSPKKFLEHFASYEYPGIETRETQAQEIKVLDSDKVIYDFLYNVKYQETAHFDEKNYKLSYVKYQCSNDNSEYIEIFENGFGQIYIAPDLFYSGLQLGIKISSADTKELFRLADEIITQYTNQHSS